MPSTPNPGRHLGRRAVDAQNGRTVLRRGDGANLELIGQAELPAEELGARGAHAPSGGGGWCILAPLGRHLGRGAVEAPDGRAVLRRGDGADLELVGRAELPAEGLPLKELILRAGEEDGVPSLPSAAILAAEP